MDSFKNVIDLCGHGFCRACLTIWPRQLEDDQSANTPETGCPVCRCRSKRVIYGPSTLSTASQPRYVLESDNDLTGIISIAGDNE
jgi:hypothetical protein